MELIRSDPTVIGKAQRIVDVLKWKGGSLLDACGGDGRLGEALLPIVKPKDLVVADFNPSSSTNAKLIRTDILELHERYTYVISNPPFGSKGSLAESKYLEIWAHIVNRCNIAALLLLPESKVSKVKLLKLEGKWNIVTSPKFEMKIMGEKFQEFNTLPSVVVRWVHFKRKTSMEEDEPIIEATVTAGQKRVGGEDYLDTFFGKFGGLIGRVTGTTEEERGQKHQAKTHQKVFSRIPRKLDSSINKTQREIMEELEHEHINLCSENCNRGIRPCGLPRQLFLVAKFCNYFCHQFLLSYDEFLSRLMEPIDEYIKTDTICDIACAYIRSEASAFHHVETFGIEKEQCNDFAILETIASLCHKVNGSGSVFGNVISESNMPRLSEESFTTDHAERCRMMAITKGYLQIDNDVCLFLIGNNLYITCGEWAGIVPSAARPCCIIAPSTILDYRVMIAEYNIGIWSHNVTGTESAGVVRDYVTWQRACRNNSVRVRRSKSMVGAVKLILACNEKSTIWAANREYVDSICEDKDCAYLERSELESLCKGGQAKTGRGKLLEGMMNKGGKQALGDLLSLEKYMAVEFIDPGLSWNKYVLRTTQHPVPETALSKRIVALYKKLAIGYAVAREGKIILEPISVASEVSARALQELIDVARKKKLSQKELTNLIPDWMVEGVRVKDCLPGYQSICVEEYLNDKSCMRKKTDIVGTKLTERELIEFCKRETVDCEECIKMVNRSSTIAGPTVGETDNLKDLLNTDLDIIKLSLKEKEQKLEGRLYGINTLEGKLGIAQFNKVCQIAAKIIPMNFMSLDENDKQAQLHEFSRLLTDKDTYFLGVDIVGHNQSYSPETMKDLVDAIVDSIDGFDHYGWENVFRNLRAVMSKPNHKGWYYIDRQITGIEGWFVYFWGIHTALAMNLFAEETPGLMCPGGSSYADDIGMLIKITSGECKIENMVMKVKKYWARLGQEVKLSQTMVSKDMFVLLKKMYVDRLPVNNGLKQLCRFSLLGDESIPSDYNTAETIQAAEAGFYESTAKEHLSGQLLSRMLLIICAIRLAAHSVCTNKLGTTIIDDDKESEELLLDFRELRKMKLLTERLSDAGINKKGILREAYVTGSIGSEISQSRTDRIKALLFGKLHAMVSLHRFIENMIFIPKQMGGFGLIPRVHLMISGFSSNIYRQLSFLKRYNNEIFLRSMAGYQDARLSLTSILNEEFPCDGLGGLEGRVIKEEVAWQLKRGSWVRNRTVLELLRTTESVRQLEQSALRIIGGAKYSFRIISSMLECSQPHYSDKLLSRLASSRTISALSTNQRIHNIKLKIAMNTRLERLVKLTRIASCSELSVLEQLEIARANHFPAMRFLNIEEPEFLDTVEPIEQGLGQHDIIGISGDPIVKTSIGFTIRKPQRFTVVREKFRKLLDMANNPKEQKLTELCRRIKWIHKASVYADPVNFKANSLILRLGEEIFRSWGEIMSIEQIENADDPEGGQILHRIKHEKGKSVVGNHLPLVISGSVSADFCASLFNISGENNNLNYKLWELEAGYLTHVMGKTRSFWKVSNRNHIKSVRVNFCEENEQTRMRYDPRLRLELNEAIQCIKMVFSSEDNRLWISTEEIKELAKKCLRSSLLSKKELKEVIRELLAERSKDTRPKLSSIGGTYNLEIRLASGEPMKEWPIEVVSEATEVLLLASETRYFSRGKENSIFTLAADILNSVAGSVEETKFKWCGLISLSEMSNLRKETIGLLVGICRAIIEDWKNNNGKTIQGKTFWEPIIENEIIYEESVIKEIGIDLANKEEETDRIDDVKIDKFISNQPNELPRICAVLREGTRLIESRESPALESRDTNVEQKMIVEALIREPEEVIVNLTGGRGYCSKYFHSLDRGARNGKSFVSITRKDEYTKHMRNLVGLPESITERTSETIRPQISKGDLALVEMSFIDNPRDFGKRLQEMHHRNNIIVRPGTNLRAVIREIDSPLWEIWIVRARKQTICLLKVGPSIDRKLPEWTDVSTKEILTDVSRRTKVVVESPSITLSSTEFKQDLVGLESFLRLWSSQNRWSNSDIIREWVADVEQSVGPDNTFIIESNCLNNLLMISGDLRTKDWKAWYVIYCMLRYNRNRRMRESSTAYLRMGMYSIKTLTRWEGSEGIQLLRRLLGRIEGDNEIRVNSPMSLSLLLKKALTEARQKRVKTSTEVVEEPDDISIVQMIEENVDLVKRSMKSTQEERPPETNQMDPDNIGQIEDDFEFDDDPEDEDYCYDF